MDLLSLTLLGGLLALDGTSLGQFMVSRPLVAGVLTGWLVGDPVLGLLIGGILEVYFISIFPVGGAEFPEGGPPTMVAVATGSMLAGPAGVALGTLLGFLLSRLGAFSTRILRRLNGRLVPDPSRKEVTPSRIIWAHMGGVALDFLRGCLLSLAGLIAGGWITRIAEDVWPLGMPGTYVLLAVGACIPAGAFVDALGGWRRRGSLFGAGLSGFLLASFVL
jgi:mannose/fructose/N-acetylgalactosamine-specific phosphotransferase system component IIC